MLEDVIYKELECAIADYYFADENDYGTLDVHYKHSTEELNKWMSGKHEDCTYGQCHACFADAFRKNAVYVMSRLLPILKELEEDAKRYQWIKENIRTEMTDKAIRHNRSAAGEIHSFMEFEFSLPYRLIARSNLGIDYSLDEAIDEKMREIK